jgi:site-specific recombinase XerD
MPTTRRKIKLVLLSVEGKVGPPAADLRTWCPDRDELVIRRAHSHDCRRILSNHPVLAVFDWCAAHGLELTAVRPFHVAALIEDFPGSKPSIKQKLAAVRMLYDLLVVRQITRSNPAHSVRVPKYVVKKGATPAWSREDAKTLLDSIPKDSLSGLRDLALIAAMFYSFARVSAVLKLKVDIIIITARAGD